MEKIDLEFEEDPPRNLSWVEKGGLYLLLFILAVSSLAFAVPALMIFDVTENHGFSSGVMQTVAMLLLVGPALSGTILAIVLTTNAINKCIALSSKSERPYRD